MVVPVMDLTDVAPFVARLLGIPFGDRNFNRG
jgi:hypothetical protein